MSNKGGKYLLETGTLSGRGRLPHSCRLESQSNMATILINISTTSHWRWVESAAPPYHETPTLLSFISCLAPCDLISCLRFCFKLLSSEIEEPQLLQIVSNILQLKIITCFVLSQDILIERSFTLTNYKGISMN